MKLNSNGNVGKLIWILYTVALTGLAFVDKVLPTVIGRSDHPQTTLELRVENLEKAMLVLRDVPIQISESRSAIQNVQDSLKRIEADVKDHIRATQK
jgi:hypothetical protein